MFIQARNVILRRLQAKGIITRANISHIVYRILAITLIECVEERGDIIISWQIPVTNSTNNQFNPGAGKFYPHFLRQCQYFLVDILAVLFCVSGGSERNSKS